MGAGFRFRTRGGGGVPGVLPYVIAGQPLTAAHDFRLCVFPEGKRRDMRSRGDSKKVQF